MRISDWSSDVCSSDLALAQAVGESSPPDLPRAGDRIASGPSAAMPAAVPITLFASAAGSGLTLGLVRGPRTRTGGRAAPSDTSRDDRKIGRASCRANVCQDE